jgi:hypothetical protein
MEEGGANHEKDERNETRVERGCRGTFLITLRAELWMKNA